MTRLLSIPLILALALLGPVGCGSDDDGGTGPSRPVFDDIVVSLDRITIIRDCDPNDGSGEFGYRFYVRIFDENGEIDQVLDTDWNFFRANDGDSWDRGHRRDLPHRAPARAMRLPRAVGVRDPTA